MSGQDVFKMIKIEVRNDIIYWVEGMEFWYLNVNKVVQKMDLVLLVFNSYFQGEYYINGRIKVM